MRGWGLGGRCFSEHPTHTSIHLDIANDSRLRHFTRVRCKLMLAGVLDEPVPVGPDILGFANATGITAASGTAGASAEGAATSHPWTPPPPTASGAPWARPGHTQGTSVEGNVCSFQDYLSGRSSLHTGRGMRTALFHILRSIVPLQLPLFIGPRRSSARRVSWSHRITTPQLWVIPHLP